MSTGLKPYPRTKDSGVATLGEVPQHWKVLPLCAVATPKSVTGQQHRELLSVYLDRGVIRFSEIEEKRTNVTSEDLSKYQAVEPGDFVLNNQQAWRGSVGVSSVSGIVSPAYLVLTLRQELMHSDFANLLFRDRAMVAQYLMSSRGVGTIQRNLYWPHLKRAVFPLPSLNEQTAIARFLDHIDRRIQKYIRAKEQLISLLEEQKQVLTHQVITGQIDVRTGEPYPEYKESGVGWLGKVPAHWTVRRLKTLCGMRSGEAITANSIEAAGNYPVYGGNGLRGFTSRYTHVGDFALIGRQVKNALCGNVHTVSGRFWASEHAVVASLRAGLALEWFAAVLRCMNLNQYSISAAQPGLSVEKVLNLFLAAPSHAEQASIAEHIQKHASESTNAINRTRREIALLSEYRTRLVADVVTGKLDVREAATELLDTDVVGWKDGVDTIQAESRSHRAEHGIAEEANA